MDSDIALDVDRMTSIARHARDLAARFTGSSAAPFVDEELVPGIVMSPLRVLLISKNGDIRSRVRRALESFATEIDTIVTSARSLDQREREIDSQLGWWSTRIDELERDAEKLTKNGSIIGREIALFRGRISGANAMLRHYGQERAVLSQRQTAAEAGCADKLAELGVPVVEVDDLDGAHDLSVVD